MKHRFLIVTLIVFLLSLTACKKDAKPTGGAQTVPSAPIVTFTPTPFVANSPVETDVRAVVYSTKPLIQPFPEPVFAYVDAIPLKTDRESPTSGSFRYYVAENGLYLQIHVNDVTFSKAESPEQVDTADFIAVYLNERGNKPAKYAVGDCFLKIGRGNVIFKGTGIATGQTKAVCYEVADGYEAEVFLPFLTIRGSEAVTVGLEIGFTDFDGEKAVCKGYLNDKSGKTDTTMKNIGLMKLENRFSGIAVDGRSDAVWELSEFTVLKNRAYGNSGANARFRVLTDGDRLYFMIQVDDNTPDTGSEIKTRKDGIELFVSFTGEKHEAYNAGTDMHFRISRDGIVSCENGADGSVITYIVYDRSSGYDVEIAMQIPDTELPETIGFDLHVNDSFGSGMRDSVLCWSDTSLMTFENLSNLGTLSLIP